MHKNIPTIKFENGEKYEIKRNRHILIEIEKMRGDNVLTDEESQNYVILQDKYSRLEKLAKRVKDLEDKYYETFGEDDGEIYERAKAHYDLMLRETTEFEISTKGVADKIQRATINKVEALVINALTMNELGETIRTRDEADSIWCSYVDEVGHETAKEWLLYAFNYLSGNDGANDSDPFIAEQKAKAERKANMRKGIATVK
jgi:hypothetical protein